MSAKKLIAVDLDGTLFGGDHEIADRTAAVLQAVADRGHTVVVVTGRSAYSAMCRLAALPSSSRVVCSNGAYEVDLQSGAMRWSQSLSATSVVSMRSKILHHLPQASFGWESLQGLNYEAKFTEEAGGAHTLEQGGLQEEFGSGEVLKLFVRTPHLQRGALQTEVEKSLNNQAEVSTSGVPFVEITAPGTNKASGLASVAESLGINVNHIIAFGDNLNDLPMLRWAGEGVAMGNAVAAVKAIADTHTSSNDAHGVAALLEQRLHSGEL